VIRSISPQKIAFWQARLEAQAQSGLTIAEFCKQQKYSASAFYQWRRRLQAITDGTDGHASLTARPPEKVTVALGLPLCFLVRYCDGAPG